MMPLIYTASAEFPEHPVSFCLDSSVEPNSFWEAPGDAPYWCQIEYSSWITFRKYFMKSGPYGPERMPKSWELQVSDDGQNWDIVDVRLDEPAWQANEIREYSVNPDFTGRFVRLYITEGGTPGILRLYEFTPEIDFQVLIPGILAWKNLGHLGVSPDGGELWLRTFGDNKHSAFHILPCVGEKPVRDGISEVTLHREDPNGLTSMHVLTIATLADEQMPYAIINEQTGQWSPVTFIKVNRISENPRDWRFQRPLVLTEDGAVRLGKNRGQQTDETVIHDETPIDVLKIERDDPNIGDGDYDSDRVSIVAKKKIGNVVQRTAYTLQATQNGLEVRKNGELVFTFPEE